MFGRTYRTASGRTVSQIVAAYGEEAIDAIGTALYEEGQGILAASQPLVPVDTGTLRSSGYVLEPVRDGHHVHVEIGYGGPATKINPKTGQGSDAYALVVHENLEAFHKVGIAKYLELPFVQALRGMPARVISRARAILGGAGAAG